MSDAATLNITGTREDPGRKLLVVLGESMTEHRLPDTGTVVIGRGDSADLKIDHPTLSRKHAKLTLSFHVTIEDEGSSNGTTVGGRRLAPGEVVLLAPGASIELGDALLVLRAKGRADVLGTSEGDASADGALERKLGRIAKAQVAVVVAGESGAGKHFVAERIHALSGQKGPLVELRCHPSLEAVEIAAAALAAQTGTLLVREPSTLPPPMQAVLANALAATKPALRSITTTTSDLASLSARGDFAPELLTRLGPITIVVPPLRARQRELAGLVDAIAQAIAVEHGRPVPLVSADALAMLGRHTWPGNVRELKDAVTRAMLLGKGRVITASHFSFDVDPAAGAKGGTLSSAVSDAEYRRILEVLRDCNGNQSRAAKVLGISRGTLISRLERYAIPRPRK